MPNIPTVSTFADRVVRLSRDAPFAGIDEKTTFWGEGYNMFNVGKYFSSYADGASENSHGTLKSSLFVAGSQYATYMLGGAGNHNVYITIEDKDGNVLALYRNTKFADFPAGEYSLMQDLLYHRRGSLQFSVSRPRHDSLP